MHLPREAIFSPLPNPRSKDWVEAATKTADQRARLETALQASTLQHIREGQSQEQKRIRAEDKIGMRLLGGDIPQSKGDDMGDVDLGGNTYNVQQPVSSFGQLAGMALLALAIGGPLSAIVWKWLDTPATTFTDTDTTTDLVIFRPDE